MIKSASFWYLQHEDWMNHITSGAYQKYYEDMYKAKGRALNCDIIKNGEIMRYFLR